MILIWTKPKKNGLVNWTHSSPYESRWSDQHLRYTVFIIYTCLIRPAKTLIRLAAAQSDLCRRCWPLLLWIVSFVLISILHSKDCATAVHLYTLWLILCLHVRVLCASFDLTRVTQKLKLSGLEMILYSGTGHWNQPVLGQGIRPCPFCPCNALDLVADYLCGYFLSSKHNDVTQDAYGNESIIWPMLHHSLRLLESVWH